ncbi:MAG: glycosyltransferase family 2 protein [Acidobacteriota bacterium]
MPHAPSRPEESPELSLVIALYNEEACLDELMKQVRATLDPEPWDYEIVFIDDGSADRTVAMAAGFAEDDSRVKLLELSRNHGKAAAVTAGIAHARGRYVLMMDPDLQDPAESIPEFHREIQKGYELVFGIRSGRQDPWATRLASKLFWIVLNGMTGLKIPPNLAVMRIMSRRFADEVARYGERVRFIEGLFMVIGLPRTTLEIEHRDRFAGESKFTWRRRLRLAVDAILAFSDRPIRWTTATGFFLLGSSLVYGAYLFFRKLLFGIGLTGWTSTTLLILFIGSIQIILLGVLGSYVGRLYTEIKARPIYTVARRWNVDGEIR